MTHFERFALCFHWFGASLLVVWFCGLVTSRPLGQLWLKNIRENQNSMPRCDFLRSSPCGVTNFFFGRSRREHGPSRVFSESRKRKQSKWKPFIFIQSWALKTLKYSNSARHDATFCALAVVACKFWCLRDCDFEAAQLFGCFAGIIVCNLPAR